MGGNVKIAKSKVPEGLVKKRARFAKQAAARNEAKAVAKKNNLLKRREFVAKARTYANAYAAEKKAALAQKKAAKAQGNFYVSDKSVTASSLDSTKRLFKCSESLIHSSLG